MTFEIYDACGLTGDAFDTVTANVGDSDLVEVAWTPTTEKLAEVTSGSLVLVAKIGESQAISSSAPVIEKLTFKVQQKDTPVETKLVLHFAGDHNVEAVSVGGETEVQVPFGRQLLWVELPEQSGERVILKDNDVEINFLMEA